MHVNRYCYLQIQDQDLGAMLGYANGERWYHPPKELKRLYGGSLRRIRRNDRPWMRCATPITAHRARMLVRQRRSRRHAPLHHHRTATAPPPPHHRHRTTATARTASVRMTRPRATHTYTARLRSAQLGQPREPHRRAARRSGAAPHPPLFAPAVARWF
eukprot:2388229-Prymnesium_polylepis.1